REGEGEDIGGYAARQRERGVARKRPRREVNLDAGPKGRVPAARKRRHPADEGGESEQEQHVDPHAVRRSRLGGPWRRRILPGGGGEGLVGQVWGARW